jgi:5-methylcytosine-specific restriction endonuclease McrA
MSKRTCDIQGCDTKHFGKGYCQKHYRRWKKHGDPTKVLPAAGGKSPTYNEDRSAKTCPHCDLMKPLEDYYPAKTPKDGKRSWCSDCTRSYHKKWIRENPERAKKHTARYYSQNKEKCVERTTRWREKNLERAKAGARRRNHIRRARLRANGGKDELKKFQYSDHCFYCKQPVDEKTRTIEHYIPIDSGGTNELSNLRTACRSCNCSKNSRTGADFFGWVIQKVCERTDGYEGVLR